MLERIGDYTLLAPLGSGAAGQVYSATPIVDKPFAKVGDLLAIKVYKPEILLEPKQAERIRREFKVGSDILHPRLVTIYEVHEAGVEPPFLVMEWVDGMTILEWAKMYHPVPSNFLLQLSRELVSGIAELHAHDFIHRDLKPSNAMISSTFHVKIMDFGVVHVKPGAESPVTPTDLFLGTIRNAAPELLFGTNLDERCDLYSLGTVLYALLYGKEIYADENQFACLVESVRGKEPEFPLDPEADSLRTSIVDLTRRLLSKRPEERPNSIAEVVAELDSFAKAAHEEPPPLKGYIATALTGLSDVERDEMFAVSNTIAEVSKNYGLYVYQPRKATDPVVHKDVKAASVYKLDRKRVLTADLLLVVVNRPSIGVGQELEIAGSYGIPTLLISAEGVVVSRMVLGAPTNFVGHLVYESLADLETKLRAALDSVAPEIRAFKKWRANFEPCAPIGAQIRELRRQAGYASSDDFAKAMSLPPSLLGLLESGEYDNVGISVLDRIAKTLGTTLAEMFAKRNTQTSVREPDPNLRELEELAVRLSWGASVFLNLRDDYLREIAAKGAAENLTREDWLNRQHTLDERRLEKSWPRV